MSLPPRETDEPIDLRAVPDEVATTVREVIDSLAFRSCYDPVRVLGSGAFGVTLLGRQRSVDRQVAIKILHNLQPDARARFQREARILCSLRHTNVIHLLDFDAVGDSMFMVMEFVEGEPLTSVIRPGGIPWPAIRSIALQVLSALEHVHQLGILHRDLKPGNIMMSPDGKVRVLDFGMVSQGADDHRLTRSGMVLGTPSYIAPEILAHSRYSTLSDLYALGVVLYELLTGVNPFVQETVAKTILDQMSRTIEEVPSTDPDLPLEVRGWVAALLRKEPELRPASATRMLEIFEAIPERGAPLEAFSGATVKLTDETPRAVPVAPPVAAPAPAGDPDPVNLIGDYEVLGLLGRGGMGIVYRARRRGQQRLLALKVMRPEFRQDPEMVRRFRREMKIHASLSHPDLVQVLDFGESDGVLYLAMELVEGETLRARLTRTDPLSIDATIAVALRIAGALDCLHERDIRHRDLKPENIFLGPDGMVKVGDFGLAADDLDSLVSRSSMGIATPSYATPELIQQSGVGKPADLHALGVLLHEMVTGRSPFPGDSTEEILEAIVTIVPGPLRSPSGSYSKRLDTLAQGLLQKDPAKRPDTRQTLAMLHELQGRKSERIRNTGTRPRSAKPERGSRAWLALPVIFVTAAIGYFATRPARLESVTYPVPGQAWVRLTGTPAAGKSYWLVPASGPPCPGRLGGPEIYFESVEPGRSYRLREGDGADAPDLGEIAVPGPDHVTGPHGVMEIHWKHGLPAGCVAVLRDRAAGFRRELPFSAEHVARAEGLAPARGYEVEIRAPDGRRVRLARPLETPRGTGFHRVDLMPRPTLFDLDYDLDRPAVLEVTLDRRDPGSRIQSQRTDGGEHGRVAFTGLTGNSRYLLRVVPLEGWGGIRRLPFVTASRDDFAFMSLDANHLGSLGDSFAENSVLSLARFAIAQRSREAAGSALAKLRPDSGLEEKVLVAEALLSTGHPRAGAWLLECLASARDFDTRERLAAQIVTYGPRPVFFPGLRRALDHEKSPRVPANLVRALVESDPALARETLVQWLDSANPAHHARGVAGAPYLRGDAALLRRTLPELGPVEGLEAILRCTDPQLLPWSTPRYEESLVALWAGCLLADEGVVPEIDRLVASTDALDRLKGILALGVLREKSPAVSLAPVLAGDSSVLADAAAWTLARTGQREAIPALVARALSGKDRSGVACWALGELGATGSTSSLRSHLAWLMGRAQPADRFQACLLAWTLARLADGDAKELLERMSSTTCWGDAGTRWAARALKRLGAGLEESHPVILFPFLPPSRMTEELLAGTGFWARVEAELEPAATRAEIRVGSTGAMRSMTTAGPGWVLMEASGHPVLTIELEGELAGGGASLQRAIDQGPPEGFLVLEIQQ